MSLQDYKVSMEINSIANDDTFYGIIMAAMRLADSDNLASLAAAWPGVWQELQARYNAPGGLLPGEYDREGGWHRRKDGSMESLE